MQAAIDGVFIWLSGPLGWLAGALAVIATLFVVWAMGRRAALRRGRWRAAVLVAGLAGAGLLLAPYVINASRVRSPLGPEPFQRASLVLPVPGREGETIGMDLWFPAVRGEVRSDAVPGCAGLLALPLANSAHEQVPLLLYMARFKGDRGDNIARMEVLASHGFAVAALDDIALDAPDPEDSDLEKAARLHDWPLGSEAEYRRSVELNMVRAGMEAKKGLEGLDSLAACAATAPTSPWSTLVDYDRVGFAGFSFGGAAASEAAALDPRIAAVASIDGTLFGRAFTEVFEAPYLFLRRDNSTPAPEDFETGPVEARRDARISARDLPQHARLGAREGSGAYFIRGTDHSSFSDALFEPHASRQWLLHNPIASFDAANAYLVDFFDMHLRGAPPRLIGKPTDDNPKVDSFAETGLLPGGDFGWPRRLERQGATRAGWQPEP